MIKNTSNTSSGKEGMNIKMKERWSDCWRRMSEVPLPLRQWWAQARSVPWCHTTIGSSRLFAESTTHLSFNQFISDMIQVWNMMILWWGRNTYPWDRRGRWGRCGPCRRPWRGAPSWSTWTRRRSGRTWDGCAQRWSMACTHAACVVQHWGGGPTNTNTSTNQ